jgi:hypothetical protein
MQATPQSLTTFKLVPANHPIRLIKALAEVALKELSPLFEQMYSEVGRPSVSSSTALTTSTIPTNFDRSIQSKRNFSTSC